MAASTACLHGDPLRGGTGVGRLQLRKSQQVGGDVVQSHRVRLNDFDELPVVLLVLQAAVQQGLGVTLDRRQRRTELVRDVGDEILAHAFQALEVGDVMQNRDGASAGAQLERRRLHLERAALRRRELQPLPLRLRR